MNLVTVTVNKIYDVLADFLWAHEERLNIACANIISRSGERELERLRSTKGKWKWVKLKSNQIRLASILPNPLSPFIAAFLSTQEPSLLSLSISYCFRFHFASFLLLLLKMGLVTRDKRRWQETDLPCKSDPQITSECIFEERVTQTQSFLRGMFLRGTGNWKQLASSQVHVKT